MLNRYRRLKEKGILSINQRNKDYILKYNSRKRYPLVDDKLKTKALALDAGIAVPALYAVIRTEGQLKDLPQILAPYEDFVIKPAHGAGGDGILVITNKILGRFRLSSGRFLSEQELSYHLSCLLSGAYSLGGHADHAIIESRVVVDEIFQDLIYEGVPDIRIIILLGYPAMAMLRLPTRLSQGKANLHQGAIGVGIDLNTGRTLKGVFQHETIDYHPDTLVPIEGLQLPYWDKILEIAASCYELTGLGYLGVDIVLDKTQGPLVLELNARPGLAIQIANGEGALQRYQKIESQAQKTPQAPLSERLDYVKTALKLEV